MTEREIERWITVNGARVPIFVGESSQDAINRHIANQNANKQESDIAKAKEEADRLNKKEENYSHITLYHGTDAEDIKEFNTKGKESNEAVFFADDKDYAEEEAYVKNSRSGKGKYIYEVSLHIKNPLKVKLPSNQFADDRVESRYIRQAKQNGNDSVIFIEDTDDDTRQTFYAVFNPKDIEIKGKEKIK